MRMFAYVCLFIWIDASCHIELLIDLIDKLSFIIDQKINSPIVSLTYTAASTSIRTIFFRLCMVTFRDNWLRTFKIMKIELKNSKDESRKFTIFQRNQ